MPWLSLVRALLIDVRLALCAKSLACRRYRPGPWHPNAPVPRQGLRHKVCSRGWAAGMSVRSRNRASSRFLHGNVAPDLLYSSPFLFFLCAFSIGAFGAHFEAISALRLIAPGL